GGSYGVARYEVDHQERRSDQDPQRHQQPPRAAQRELRPSAAWQTPAPRCREGGSGCLCQGGHSRSDLAQPSIRMLVGSIQPVISKSAPLWNVCRTLLAKGTTSAALK